MKRWRRFDDAVSAPAISTTAEVLPGGPLLELIFPSGPAEKPKLLVWKPGKKPRAVDTFEFRGRLYTPASLSPGTADAIQFPSQGASYGSAQELFTRILEIAKRFFGLPDRDLRSVAYWVVASWFPELSVPITLIVTGPSRSEVRRFLRFLRRISRRGLLVTELDPAGFLAIPRALRPTLIIDQGDFSRRMRGLLRAASGRGAYVVRRGHFLDLRCVKAIFSNDLNLDVSEGFLRAAVGPAQPNSADFDDRVETEIATELQAKLLQYRLQNYAAVMESTFDAPGFTAGVRELAQSLAASVTGDADLTQGVTSLLSRVDEDARARWTALLESAIVTVLLALVHERKERRVQVKKLSEFVNATLSAGGELAQFSPEEIGHRLAALSLFTSRMAGGMVIKFTREVNRQIHDLKRIYGVNTSPTSFPGCPDCEQAEKPDTKEIVKAV